MQEDFRKLLIEKKPEVFQLLYRKYANMIIGHVKKNSGSDQDAQELIQLTMVKLWLAVKEGRYEEQGKLDHFVFQIAANSWREELRRRKNQGADEIDQRAYNLVDNSEESYDLAIQKDRKLQAIHQALKQLKGDCREIIELYHLKQGSLKEMAVQLNYNYNNLRKKIFDCRNKLKKIAEKIVAAD